MSYQDDRAHDFALALLRKGTMGNKQIAETAWDLVDEMEAEGEKRRQKRIYRNAV